METYLRIADREGRFQGRQSLVQRYAMEILVAVDRIREIEAASKATEHALIASDFRYWWPVFRPAPDEVLNEKDFDQIEANVDMALKFTKPTDPGQVEQFLADIANIDGGVMIGMPAGQSDAH